MNLDYGTLLIRAYVAESAVPVADVEVSIRGADASNKDVIYYVITDSDGVTDRIKLPAPSASLSLAPSPGALPYSNYDLEITKDGYYTKNIRSVPIFAGVSADLPVNMIPNTEGSEFPIGNINAVITENPRL